MPNDRTDKKRSYENLVKIFLLTTFFHDKSLSLRASPDAPHLTPREREALLRAAGGRSDFDNSCILNVSASTIRFHWNNIFVKLGSRAGCAVVTSMQLQIIAPELIDWHRRR